MIKKLIKQISIFKRMLKYKKVSYSFGGCDLLVDYIFKNQSMGFYVDVGCQHPISNNNTYLLFKRGWSGVNIDLDQSNINLFKIARPKDFNICSALSSAKGNEVLYFAHDGSPINSVNKNFSENIKNKYIKKNIDTDTLNNVLKKLNFDKIDYLNIDVEGQEEEVLNGFDIKLYSPKVVSVEFLDFSMKKMEFKNNNLENVLNSNIFKYFKSNNYNFVNWSHADLIFVNSNFKD